jgi:hypothetical protein
MGPSRCEPIVIAARHEGVHLRKLRGSREGWRRRRQLLRTRCGAGVSGWATCTFKRQPKGIRNLWGGSVVAV